MPILRLIDGEKRSLLSLHGVRQHKRLFWGSAGGQNDDDDGFPDLGICGTLRDIGRATDRDWALIDPTHPIPRSSARPGALYSRRTGAIWARWWCRLTDFEIL